MKSLAELQAIRDKARGKVTLREGQDDAIRVLVGMATCGIAAGARPVLNGKGGPHGERPPGQRQRRHGVYHRREFKIRRL